MRINELIEELEGVKEEHGNLKLHKYIDQYGPGRSPLEKVESRTYIDRTIEDEEKVIVLLLD